MRVDVQITERGRSKVMVKHSF